MYKTSSVDAIACSDGNFGSAASGVLGVAAGDDSSGLIAAAHDWRLPGCPFQRRSEAVRGLRHHVQVSHHQ